MAFNPPPPHLAKVDKPKKGAPLPQDDPISASYQYQYPYPYPYPQQPQPLLPPPGQQHLLPQQPLPLPNGFPPYHYGPPPPTQQQPYYTPPVQQYAPPPPAFIQPPPPPQRGRFRPPPPSRAASSSSHRDGPRLKKHVAADNPHLDDPTTVVVEPKVVALGPGESWYVQWSDGHEQWELLPSKIHEKLLARKKSPSCVKFVALGPEGQSYVQFSDNSHFWWGAPTDLTDCLMGETRLPEFVSFGPGGAWFVAFQNGGTASSTLPHELKLRLVSRQPNLGELRRVSMNETGGYWAMFADGHQWRNGLAPSLQHALEKRICKHVVLGVDGQNFIFGQVGCTFQVNDTFKEVMVYIPTSDKPVKIERSRDRTLSPPNRSPSRSRGGIAGRDGGRRGGDDRRRPGELDRGRGQERDNRGLGLRGSSENPRWRVEDRRGSSTYHSPERGRPREGERTRMNNETARPKYDDSYAARRQSPPRSHHPQPTLRPTDRHNPLNRPPKINRVKRPIIPVIPAANNGPRHIRPEGFVPVGALPNDVWVNPSDIWFTVEYIKQRFDGGVWGTVHDLMHDMRYKFTAAEDVDRIRVVSIIFQIFSLFRTSCEKYKQDKLNV